jgi:hypothetical protein
LFIHVREHFQNLPHEKVISTNAARENLLGRQDARLSGLAEKSYVMLHRQGDITIARTRKFARIAVFLVVVASMGRMGAATPSCSGIFSSL